MDNEENWICLHRRIVNSDVFKHPTLFRFFTYLLCNVADECEERVVFVGESERRVIVCGGEVAIDFKKIVADLSITEGTVHKNLQRLEAIGVITRVLQNDIWRAVFVNYSRFQAARDGKVQPRSYYEVSCFGDEIDLTDFRPCKLSTKSFIEIWGKYVEIYNRKHEQPMSIEYADASLRALESKYGDNPDAAQIAVLKQVEKLKKARVKKSTGLDDKVDMFLQTYPKIRKNPKERTKSAFIQAVDRLVEVEVVRIAGYTKTFSSKDEAANFLIARASKYADSDFVKNSPEFVPGPSPWLNGEKYLEEAWDDDLMNDRKKSAHKSEASVTNTKEGEAFIKDITKRIGN